MGFKQLTGLIRDLHYKWAGVAGYVDVKEACGGIRVDVDLVLSRRGNGILLAKTPVSQGWVDDEGVDIALDAADGKGAVVL